MRFINESGLYRLIFASRKPEAEKFRRWVFHEVLPSIRKTGYYSVAKKKKKELPQLPPNLFDGLTSDFAKAVKIITFLEEHDFECDYKLVPEEIMGEDGKATLCYNFELVIKN